jgi:hypothetical protein
VQWLDKLFPVPVSFVLLDKLLPLLRLHGLLLWVHWVHPEKEQVRLHVLLCMIVSTRLHVLLCMNVRLQLLELSTAQFHHEMQQQGTQQLHKISRKAHFPAMQMLVS